MENQREMDELSRRLSQMKTRDEKLDLLVQTATSTRWPGRPQTMKLGERYGPDTNEAHKMKKRSNDILVHTLARRHDLEIQFMERLTSKMLEGVLPSENPWIGPATSILCANVHPSLLERCSNVGNKACSGCGLVQYCSSICQNAHWKWHKGDCKHPLNSKDWTPAWIREFRDPVFSQVKAAPSPFDLSKGHRAVGLGHSLWGNVPAIDLLNLEKNEGRDYKEDLSLVFAASGDLRNVLFTVNNIPKEYPGRLSIVINDLHPQVAARNLLIMLLLISIKEESLAADVALHLWYSAFIPGEYQLRLLAAIKSVLANIKGTSTGMRLDWGNEENGRVLASFNGAAYAQFLCYVKFGELVDPTKAAAELAAVMFAPHRVDYRDRYHCKLRPAHRIAMREYQSFGLLLPFGAPNPHFNTPNCTLFNEDLKWNQDDLLYPTEGWNLTEAIASGKRHGATPQDIFGCLYFYITEQIIQFKRQLGNLKVTVHMTDVNCRELAATIQSLSVQSKSGPSSKPQSHLHGLPTKFDCIDVSNTVDDVYVGYEKTLQDWGHLLNDRNASSTLLSYSMNWIWKEPGSRPDDDEAATERITRQLIRDNRFGHIPRRQLATMWSPAAMIMKDASSAMYENSRAFENFLRTRKVYKTASDVGLQMKATHTITPRRHGVPLDAPLGTLPVFSNDEEWYQKICLSRHSYFTRFQEFSASHACSVAGDSDRLHRLHPASLVAATRSTHLKSFFRRTLAFVA